MGHDDPWIGINAPTTRRARADGQVRRLHEALDVESPPRACTINGGDLTYGEDPPGSLELARAIQPGGVS